MQVYMITNGLDISALIKEDGITQSEFTRKSTQVVTLAGYLEEDEIVKRRIAVKLMEMRDTKWYELCAALKVRPVTVQYIDDKIGKTTKVFYVRNPSATARVVIGGNTYFSGGTFTLEEV